MDNVYSEPSHACVCQLMWYVLFGGGHMLGQRPVFQN